MRLPASSCGSCRRASHAGSSSSASAPRSAQRRRRPARRAHPSAARGSVSVASGSARRLLRRLRLARRDRVVARDVDRRLRATARATPLERSPSASAVPAVAGFFRFRPPREPRRVFFFGFGASSASAASSASVSARSRAPPPASSSSVDRGLFRGRLGFLRDRRTLPRRRLAGRLLGLALGGQRLGRRLRLADRDGVGAPVEHALDAHLDALADRARPRRRRRRRARRACRRRPRRRSGRPRRAAA